MKIFYVRKHILPINILPINITTSQVAETHLQPIAMTPSMCILKLCKNPKPQVTPWVSVFVISSTLSSGSLKGHYKPGKSMNDVMQSSHVAYCVAQHSILTDSTYSLFRGYYHCSTPKIQSCFIYTSLKTKCKERQEHKKVIILKCLKICQRKNDYVANSRKSKLGEVRFMVPCEILILLLCASSLCSERRQSHEKYPAAT